MKIPAALMEKFASHDEEAKAAMKCAWLDCESQRLLATDGHMAARVTIGLDEGDITGLVPLEVFDLARKELKAIRKILKEDIADPWLRVLCGEDAIVIENLLSKTNHIVIRPKLGDTDKFPAIDAVFPKKIKAATITMSRDVLTTLLSAVDGDAAISFWVQADDKAVLVAPCTGEVACVLMPMKGGMAGETILSRGAVAETEK